MDDELKTKLKIAGFLVVLPFVMLILCLWTWPYFYYFILRIIVCSSGIGMATMSFTRFIMFFEDGKKISYLLMLPFVVTFPVVVLLFNPLIPVHLPRDVWVSIDLFTAGLFVLGFFCVLLPWLLIVDD